MRASAPGAAVVDARRRHVEDPPAGGAQAALPLLLVARPRARGVELPDRSSAARRTARFAPQTSSASRSAGPRSSVVTGAGSRPQACRFVPSSRARIGPPNASCPGWPAAAASIASSQPGHAATSSSRKHSRSAARRLDRRVACDVEPARRGRAPRSARRARVASALGLGVGAVVLHDDDLCPVPRRLRRRRSRAPTRGSRAGAGWGRGSRRRVAWPRRSLGFPR